MADLIVQNGKEIMISEDPFFYARFCDSWHGSSLSHVSNCVDPSKVYVTFSDENIIVFRIMLRIFPHT